MADNQNIIDQEIWKPIPGFPGYEASTHGRIRSYRNAKEFYNIPHVLKNNQFINKKYYYVDLSIKCKKFRFKISRLILLTFVGPCPTNMEACHNDDNGANDFLYNLRWDTKSSNLKDSYKHGLRNKKGENHHLAKFSTSDILLIRHLYSKGKSQSFIGKIFNVDRSYVSMIVNRKVWLHI